MQVLFLTPQLPWPPDQGTKLRNLQLIQAAARAHVVDLLSFAADPTDAAAGAALGQLCRRVETVPAPRRTTARRALDLVRTALPDMGLRLWSPAFRDRLRERVAEQRYDLVQFEGIELGRYLFELAPAPPATGRRSEPGPRLVFDDHNVEYLLQRRAWETDRQDPRRWHAALYSLLQWPRLARLEAAVCRAADAVIAVSPDDAAALRRLVPAIEPAVIPNAIDARAYPFRPGGARPGATLLFTGKLDFRPNVDALLWFCDTVLPLVRARRPDARLVVVGRDPHPRLRQRLAGAPGVELIGPAPDLTPYWERATVYVLPMRVGGGVRFKALEAMACGLPLVATALGVEGIAATPGRDYLRAETPAAFAAAVVRLLDEPALRDALAASARALVRAAYDWSAVSPALLDLYERLAAAPSPRRGT